MIRTLSNYPVLPSKKGENQHYMDNKVPSQKVTQELARELLIAISYSVPDPNTKSGHASKPVDGANGAVVENVDEDDKYRSELISISDAQSPDPKVPPAVLGNHAG